MNPMRLTEKARRHGMRLPRGRICHPNDSTKPFRGCRSGDSSTPFWRVETSFASKDPSLGKAFSYPAGPTGPHPSIDERHQVRPEQRSAGYPP